MPDALLEIQLIDEGPQGSRASARYIAPGSVTEASPAERVVVSLDPSPLPFPWVDPQGYGDILGRQLFAEGPLADAVSEAWRAAAAHAGSLRLRIRVAYEARALHAICWELLRVPGLRYELDINGRVLVSRTIDTPALEPVALPERAALQGLVVVAHGSDHERYELSTIDVSSEVAHAVEALEVAGIQAAVAARATHPRVRYPGATFEQLSVGIRGAHVLYLICHGTLTPHGTDLYLEREDGTVQGVHSAMLTELIRSVVPRPILVVLVACGSAGASGQVVLEAAGPDLARAGVPAVVAMQGDMFQPDARQFITAMFAALARDGDVERAVTAGRVAISRTGSWWTPVLWTCLPEGRLYSLPPVRPVVPQMETRAMGALIGRTALVDTLLDRLAGAGRGLAIWGTAGVGKTHLLEAIGTDARCLRAFPDGVLAASLGADTDLPSLLRRWIERLGGQPQHGIQVEAQSAEEAPLTGQLSDLLRDQSTLLVIDNVWKSSYDAARALASCAGPRCRVIFGSRSHTIAADLADMPDACIPVPVLATSDARYLFRQLAGPVADRETDAVAQLIEALGYLPLAIRLAARWVRSPGRPARPCAALLATWRDSVDELRERGMHNGIVDPSLQAVIAVSVQSLGEAAAREAALSFAAFAPTPATWDDAAMQAVWGLDARTSASTAAEILDSGLISGMNGLDGWRYTMHQTVQAVLAQLHSSLAQANLRHAEHYGAIAQQQASEIAAGRLTDSLSLLDREQAQIMAALSWSAEARSIDAALAIAGGMWRYWSARRSYRLAQAYLDRVLALTSELPPDDPRLAQVAELYAGAGNVAVKQAHYPAAWAFLTRSQALHERRGEPQAIGLSKYRLGRVAHYQGEYDQARALWDEARSIFTALYEADPTPENQRQVALVTANLGLLHQDRAEFTAAEALLRAAIDDFARLNSVSDQARYLDNLGENLRLQRRLAEAQACYEASLKLRGSTDTPWEQASSLEGMGQIALLEGRFDAAERYFLDSLRLATPEEGEDADGEMQIWCVEGFADLAAQRGLAAQAAAFLSAAEQARQIEEIDLPPVYEQGRAQLRALLEATLGAEAFESAWSAGAASGLAGVVKALLVESGDEQR